MSVLSTAVGPKVKNAPEIIWVPKAAICSPFGGIQQRDCFKLCRLVPALLLRTAVSLEEGDLRYVSTIYHSWAKHQKCTRK